MDMKKSGIFIILISCLCIALLIGYKMALPIGYEMALPKKDKYSDKHSISESPPLHVLSNLVDTVLSEDRMQSKNISMTKMGNQIIEVSKLLHVAQMHVRGAKTSRSLKDAKSVVDNILQSLGTSFQEVTKRKIFKSKSVCPEYYGDAAKGFPIFDIGYLVKNCSYAKPIADLVTIVILDEGSSSQRLEDVLSGLEKYDKTITVIIGTYASKIPAVKYEVIQFSSSTSKGDALNTLIAKVETEYTLMARDVTHFNYDARIERLVREIERLNVAAVAGSIRNSDSIWSLACHQRVFRNFTLVYKEGYDESMHDCVFCDHVDGPFLIKTAEIQRLNFDGKIEPMGVYEDFFMRLEGEAAVCPDAMFYVDFPKRSENMVAWERFGRKRNLYKLTFSDGLTIHFGCNYDYTCEKVTGYVRPPCCNQELSDLNNDVMKLCEDENIISEVQCGTQLGATKLNKVLPWEVDGDIRIWYMNYTAFERVGPKLEKKGYRFRKVKPGSYCIPLTKRMADMGYFLVTSKHWFVEVYEFCGLTAYDLKLRNITPTKVLHDGYPITTSRNPSLAARNLYPQFYSHVQHFSEGGIWNVHTFSKCNETERHDCIDKYQVDGNIQFNDPIP